MIYAQLRAVPAWNSWMTPAVFLCFAAAGGALLAATIAAGTGENPHDLLVVAIPLQVAAWAAKIRYWKRSATIGTGASSIDSATGLGQRGPVRLLEPPHTGSNYLLKEMGYAVARAARRSAPGPVPRVRCECHRCYSGLERERPAGVTGRSSPRRVQPAASGWCRTRPLAFSMRKRPTRSPSTTVGTPWQPADGGSQPEDTFPAGDEGAGVEPMRLAKRDSSPSRSAGSASAIRASSGSRQAASSARKFPSTCPVTRSRPPGCPTPIRTR